VSGAGRPRDRRRRQTPCPTTPSAAARSPNPAHRSATFKASMIILPPRIAILARPLAQKHVPRQPGRDANCRRRDGCDYGPVSVHPRMRGRSDAPEPLARGHPHDLAGEAQAAHVLLTITANADDVGSCTSSTVASESHEGTFMSLLARHRYKPWRPPRRSTDARHLLCEWLRWRRRQQDGHDAS
jgi:hypothetical protein